jgi:hypothetical protein
MTTNSNSIRSSTSSSIATQSITNCTQQQFNTNNNATLNNNFNQVQMNYEKYSIEIERRNNNNTNDNNTNDLNLHLTSQIEKINIETTETIPNYSSSSSISSNTASDCESDFAITRRLRNAFE